MTNHRAYDGRLLRAPLAQLAVFVIIIAGTNTGPGGTGHAVRISGYESWTMGNDGLIGTAIALDFVIVVVGVFIGLQVNLWNEARVE